MNENQQNPYNQQPQCEPMPPFAPMLPNNGVRGRAYGVRGMRIPSAFPKWLSQYPIAVYLIVLAIVSFMYSAYSLPWYYMLSGVVSIGVFFLYGSTLAKETGLDKMRKENRFEKRIFLVAIIPRLFITILLYWIFQSNYGDAFGFENADAQYYDRLGGFVAGLIGNGNFHLYDEISRWSRSDDMADMGYGVYVGLVYLLTNKSIITVRILKCFWSALTVILIYRLAKRNFGEQTGRMTAIFCALWPNFWYYCSVHLKETEMVFLTVLFVEQADQMLRSRQFTAWKVIPVLLIAAAIATFRTPLAIVALLSIVFSVVMTSSRVMTWGKRIIVGLLAVTLIGVTAWNSIEENTRQLVEKVQSHEQEESMQYRTTREHGNSFAKYAGASVFAPMIFTLPFPTMVRPWDGQEVQQLLNGGNFTKNIVSFFTIMALITLLMSGKWREHMLPLSFMLGYLIVLTMSSFAQSERFHQPVMPFELMFAAYGLSIAVTQKKYKRWFTYWCGLMFVATIAWNWFKLAGRGLT